MKIIGILGSPSKMGNTSILAREILRGAREKGADVEEIFLPEYTIEYCKGCMQCIAHGRCCINDDLEYIREKLYASEGIVLASPTYGVKPCARMKNLLVDRIGAFTAYTSSLGGKYIVGVSTAGGIGAKKVAKILAYENATGFFKRGYVSGYLGVCVGHKKIDDYPDSLIKAYKLGEKMVLDIKQKKKYFFQNIRKRLLFGIIVKRLIKKNIAKNKKSGLKAVYENLVKRNLIQEN